MVDKEQTTESKKAVADIIQAMVGPSPHVFANHSAEACMDKPEMPAVPCSSWFKSPKVDGWWCSV